ncbi:MAG: HDOD domain-containing protein [candidate division Zixibacteria bacterium]|nr:HDOD domain-containing protein [candidate division Zixibacteria bacterium]
MYNILVVDDEFGIRETIKRRLESTGQMAADTAKDGAEAASRLLTTDYDCILLDIMMPGIDGLEVCRRLRENPETRHIPVIMVTAMSDEERVKTAMGYGISGYVLKPFKSEELIGRVQACLTDSASDHSVYERKGQSYSNNVSAQEKSVTRENTSVHEYLSRFLRLGRGELVIERLADKINENPNIILTKDLVATDIIIVADLYRVANSAFYGGGRGIFSISDLLRLVGSAGFYHNILGSGRTRVKSNKLMQNFIQSGFWSRNLCTACLAEEMGACMRMTNREELYMAGLLHEIGVLFFISYYPEKYKKILNQKDASDSDRLKFEKQIFGMDHGRLGTMILNKWNLPVRIQNCCLVHWALLSEEDIFKLSNSELLVSASNALSHLLDASGDSYQFSARSIKLLRLFFAEKGIKIERIIKKATARINGIAEQLKFRLPYDIGKVESEIAILIENSAETIMSKLKGCE